jgi:hypothetical protein
MFQSAAVDIAIGLVLMYLVLSLLCTVINEFIATKLGLRSKTLATGMQELLDDPAVRDAFYHHGLIAGTRDAVARVDRLSLVRKADDHPSYISADTFVLALIGSITGMRSAQGQQVPGFPDVESAIQNLPASKIKSALVASLMTAQGNFDAFRRSVGTWFDDSMDRLGGAYKRHLKFISIVVGSVVAIVINADTFEVGRALWLDSVLRAQMMQAADATVTASVPAPSAAATGERSPTDIENGFKQANQTLRPLPLGWPACTRAGTTDRTSASSRCPDSRPGLTWAWISFSSVKVTGWLATSLAPAARCAVLVRPAVQIHQHTRGWRQTRTSGLSARQISRLASPGGNR